MEQIDGLLNFCKDQRPYVRRTGDILASGHGGISQSNNMDGVILTIKANILAGVKS